MSDKTDWVVRHACCTLLKLGYTEIMALFGINSGQAFSEVILTLSNEENTKLCRGWP